MHLKEPDTVAWAPDAYHHDTLFDSDGDVVVDEVGPVDRWWRPTGFAEWFAIGLTFLPAILYLPNSQPYRLPARIGAYGISVYAFTMWWLDRGGRKATKHPAERWLVMIAVLLGVMIAHPGT